MRQAFEHDHDKTHTKYECCGKHTHLRSVRFDDQRVREYYEFGGNKFNYFCIYFENFKSVMSSSQTTGKQTEPTERN